MAFSGDGGRLAAACGRAVYVWDVAGGKEPLCLNQHRDEVVSVAFHPDGKHLITGEKGLLHFWDLATGRQRRKWRAIAQGSPHESLDGLTRCFAQALSADGRTMAWGLIRWKRSAQEGLLISEGGFVRICDGATGLPHRDIPSLAEHTLLSPAGTTLATASNYRILLNDVATGRVLGDIQGLSATILALAFSPDGKTLVSAHGDQSLHFWDAATGKPLLHSRPPVTPDQFDARVSLAFFADGKTLAIGGSPVVRLRTFPKGEEINPFHGHRGPVRHVSFSADGKTLTSRSDDVLHHWATDSWRVRGGMTGARYEDVRKGAVALSPDGKRFVKHLEDGSLILVDADSGKGIRPLEGKHPSPASAGFSDDGGKVFVVHPGKEGEIVRVFDSQTGARFARFSAPGGIAARALSLDGRSFAFAGGGVTTVADTSTGASKRLRTTAAEQLQRQFLPERLLAFSAEGDVLVEIPARTWVNLAENVRPALSVWRVRSGRKLFDGDEGPQTFALSSGQQVSVSPDGRLIALSQGDAVVRVWEVASGNLWCQLEGHRDPITALAFSPDGTLLASGSADTTVLIWDMTGARTKAARKKDLTPEEVDRLWDNLAVADGGRAEEAVWGLVAAARQSVPFLKGQLQPVRKEQTKRVRALLADLDSAKFLTREKATVELEKMLDLVEPALEKLLQGAPSLEVRRRVEGLLKKVRQYELGADRRRELRALEVLERVGNAESREIVLALARGAPEARLTEEAEAVLRRLDRIGKK
jgi:WD40 repeat protein